MSASATEEALAKLINVLEANATGHPGEGSAARMRNLLEQQWEMVAEAARQEAHRSTRRFELLSRLAAELLTTRDHQHVIARSCRRVMAMLECDIFFHYVLDQKTGRLHLKACGGLTAEMAASFEWLELGAAVCGAVAATGSPVVLQDVLSRTDEREHFQRQMGLQSYACFPVAADGRVLGTLSFGSRTQRSLPDSDVAMIRALADQIAIAIQRVSQEQSLRESEERRQLALQATQDGIWDWNPVTQEYVWSERLTGMLGYEPGEIPATAESFNHLLHPDDVERTWTAVKQYLRRETDVYRVEFRMRHKDGSYRWILSRGLAFFDEAGRPTRMVGAHTDITERKRFETALKQAKESAEAANNAKDQFLAVLSHELRTPLTPVLTAAQMLEGRDDLPGEHRELVRMIRRNVQLEARLIDDLLDLTRVSRGKLELFCSNIDLHEKLRHVVGICESDAASKGHSVSIELGAERHQLQADGARIQQVLWNLLKNAIKFTPPGGSIRAKTRNVGDCVQVQISDTGCGIDPQCLQSIFDAFQQGGKHVTRQFGGLGLGLTICKSLVEAHGGTIVAASEGPGQGSTFTVVLPLSSRASEARGAATETAETPGGDHRLARILLVEDNEDTLRMMRKLLERDGYLVSTADGVARALGTIQAEDVDLLISDIGLPDGSGLDLMKQARAIRPVRGIAISGYGMEEDRRRSREAGFSEHLIKPVDLGRLEQMIERVLHETP